MPFIAQAEHSVPANPEACFARLADFPSWSRWMPSTFQPVSGPARSLAVGDVMAIRIRGVPGAQSMKLVIVEPGRRIAWAGGVPGVLSAVHEFQFEPQGTGTRMRSVEAWEGLLSRGPVAWQVKRMAERIGAQQLATLAADLALQP